MKSENFIIIQGWMRTDLELKGNELLLYALIYGFSQDKESKFSGSLKYCADWIGCSKSTVQETLSKLIEKQLIVKEESTINSIKFCKYSISERYTENRYGGIPEIGTGGIPEIGTNNILNNNIKKDSLLWRTDFNVYLDDLRKVYKNLIADTNFITLQEKFHPGIDIKLSLEKACKNFWATEAGWKHKKGKKSKTIDWKSTLTNAIELNKVRKSFNNESGTNLSKTYTDLENYKREGYDR